MSDVFVAAVADAVAVADVVAVAVAVSVAVSVLVADVSVEADDRDRACVGGHVGARVGGHVGARIGDHIGASVGGRLRSRLQLGVVCAISAHGIRRPDLRTGGETTAEENCHVALLVGRGKHYGGCRDYQPSSSKATETQGKLHAKETLKTASGF